MLNAEIETILSSLTVPVNYLFYDGQEDTYVIYGEMDTDNALGGDDDVIGVIAYYDIDIYSVGDYMELKASIISLMVTAGWTYQPSRNSPDMYERDTKYFHKTLCFAKESEV